MKSVLQRAKEGDPAAFRRLIAENQRLLYSIVLSRVDPAEADDLIQQTWEKALRGIRDLRDDALFTPWLCRICRNVLLDAQRRNRMSGEPWDDEFLYGWEKLDPLFDQYGGLVRMALQLLPTEQRTAVQLRFFSNFSYAEIALVCGVPEKRIKSRLFDAKKKLKVHLKNLYHGLEVPRENLKRMEEIIMTEFEKITLGADVFCRLSLETQKNMVFCVSEASPLTPAILQEIGKTRGGRHFAEIYHNRILLPELSLILGVCDRYTEFRLITELEETAPETAELVKQNSFVFEDLVLLSIDSRKRLFDRIEAETMKQAMSLVSRKVKEILLSDFSENDREKWYLDMGKMSADIEEVRGAQAEIVKLIRDMSERDEIEIVEMPG